MKNMDNLINFILYPQFVGKLALVRVVFIAISALFILGIYYFVKNSSWLKNLFWEDFIQFITWKPFETRKFIKTWQKIIKRLEKGLESEYKLAVIEADSVLNDILKRLGYVNGESLGERLDQVDKDFLSNLEEIRNVHSVCSSIIHDPDYTLSLEKAREIISVYEKALTELEAF